MRFAALLSLAAIAAGALTPSPVPQFETLFVGQFIIGPDSSTIDTPFGTRIYATVLGSVLNALHEWRCPLTEQCYRGNFTDPSGILVATMLPGTTDTGFVNVNPGGLFFPDAVIVWRWEVDQTLAYIRTRGVG